MKKCSKCEQLKDVGEFHRSKIAPDGYKSYCKVCNNTKNAKHRAKNPEYYQQWRDEHKEVVKEHNIAYRAIHREEMNATRLERARQNPEHEKAKKKAWYEANKDKVIERKRRRRDREIVCGEIYSREHERATLKAFDNKCFKCGSKDQLHIDHHRPLVKGYALSLDNAVVLCEFCNKSKGTKDPEKFYGTIQCLELDNKLAQIKYSVKQ